MTELWLGFAVLLVLAIGFICVPLFVTLRRGELVRDQANIEIYKDQLADLQTELEAGRIEAAEYEQLTTEVKRNLLADTEKQQVQQEQNSTSPSRGVIAASIVLTVVVSVLLYKKLGAENELAITELLQRSMMEQEQWSAKDNQALLDRLAVKVKAEPKDVEAWYMIGRINFEMGRFDEAVLGFNNALTHLPLDATQDRAVAIAQMAQAQFFANDRKLDAATEGLLNEALKLNPNDSTTLGLLGVAAFESEQYMKAINYWRQLLTFMPANSPNTAPIQSGIQKAISMLPADERKQLLADMQAEMEARKANSASIMVTVDLSDAIRAQVPANADLFVLAKAENGPALPLAVQRVAVDSWPITVELNDDMAMMPQFKLSSFENVVITARISKSGEGRATAGDIEGVSDAMSVKDKQVNVTLAYVVE